MNRIIGQTESDKGHVDAVSAARVLIKGMEPPDGSATGSRPNTVRHADRTAPTTGAR